jgi:hypothetical protein
MQLRKELSNLQLNRLVRKGTGIPMGIYPRAGMGKNVPREL